MSVDGSHWDNLHKRRSAYIYLGYLKSNKHAWDISRVWYQHYDADSSNMYYECITTTFSWEPPSSGEVYVHKGLKTYYECVTHTTTWEQPEEFIAVEPSEAHEPEAHEPEAPSLLEAARRALRQSNVSPPRKVRTRGDWWEVSDERGVTCYLNSRTKELVYSRPKGWVRSMVKTRFNVLST